MERARGNRYQSRGRLREGENGIADQRKSEGIAQPEHINGFWGGGRLKVPVSLVSVVANILWPAEKK